MNILKTAIITSALVLPISANAALVGFEYSGLAHESSSALNIPWGSFAGGRIVYDTELIDSMVLDGNSSTKEIRRYLFSTPPAEFTFEIYKKF